MKGYATFWLVLTLLVSQVFAVFAQQDGDKEREKKYPYETIILATVVESYSLFSVERTKRDSIHVKRFHLKLKNFCGSVPSVLQEVQAYLYGKLRGKGKRPHKVHLRYDVFNYYRLSNGAEFFDSSMAEVYYLAGDPYNILKMEFPPLMIKEPVHGFVEGNKI